MKGRFDLLQRMRTEAKRRGLDVEEVDEPIGKSYDANGVWVACVGFRKTLKVYRTETVTKRVEL